MAHNWELPPRDSDNCILPNEAGAGGGGGCLKDGAVWN